ncbi:MAG TPA: thiamine pyrophosphate-binding protein [Streptosporangiaceae bacterium]
MTVLNGAQALTATLERHGVDTVFGIPGVHTLPLYDALRDSGMRHVLARHEQGAGFMAYGYARATGRVGVAVVISGPGVTNIATPMANAYSDSVPVLTIATTLPRDHDGRERGALHELKDQYASMAALVGWSRRVADAAELPGALAEAFAALTARRPRGAYLEIPLDLLTEPVPAGAADPLPAARPTPSGDQVRKAAELLVSAERPVIFAGAGTADCADQLRTLAERLGAPVLLGPGSKGVLPDGHPLAVASRISIVPGALHDLIGASDVALIIGTKLGDERTAVGELPMPATRVRVDLDPAELTRRFPVDLGIHADAGAFLDALLPLVGDATADSADSARAAASVAAVNAAFTEFARAEFEVPTEYLDAVRAALPADGVTVADMTQLGYASAELFPVDRPRAYLHPYELCSIGCGLPVALGARVGVGERPVVALCGDGGILQTIGELATAAQEGIAVTVVVFNDRTYSAVHQNQRRFYDGRVIATELVAPDYVTLATSFGLTAARADSPEALRAALAEAVGRTGPSLIEVPIPRATG